MAKMYVAFLLDLFQPSSQNDKVIDEVTRECYQPLVELFNSKPNAKFTVSLANSLASLLIEFRKDKVIEGLKQAVKFGKIEMIHTGAYHPIFPLLPDQEVKRQIALDKDLKSEHFGVTTTSGIFSPEMCYHDKLLPLYQEMGFQWTIIDDCVMEINGIRIPQHEIYHVNDIAVFMRSELWSNRIKNGHHLTGREFVRQMEAEIQLQQQDCYTIIAISGETFGHHVKYYQETFLRDMLCKLSKSDSVELCLVSDLLNIKGLSKIEKPKEVGQIFEYFPPCSWATQPDNYKRGDYYPLWKSKDNPIHENLWKLTDLIWDANSNINFNIEGDEQHSGLNKLRDLLDRAFYSTQYFWASIWFWNPERIYEGIDLQMRTLYLTASLMDNYELLKAGQEIYTQLMWAIHQRTQEELNSELDKSLAKLNTDSDFKKRILPWLNSIKQAIDYHELRNINNT
ncbi:MAG: hypothetical protein DM484_02325 [Candidatus Methylumidiphilus alinenensis]|uniref:Glycoside hydrolase family 57 N-terminal domain-containing protein n=1 Tax=Candidatus Methylumidiphilus alinenensis TaxID=2202197 RepID=A0A2W4RR52_9GAMM|nr:MAG: hypothetical protein DM484_02325 [Candidatus Methylumidiphilus alinenensis]